MGDRFGFRLLVGLALIATLAGVGFYAYNMGVAHGIAESGRIAAVAAPGGPVPVVPIGLMPWRFGFGLFPFFPLFGILFWILVLRALFWRRPWWGYRGYYGYRGMPPMFEEWHRRAHAEQPPASGTHL